MPLALVHIHNDKQEVALCPGEQRDQQKAADATNTEERDALTGFDATSTKGMHRHRARLCQRRSFIAAGLRHSRAHPGGYLHQFSKTAVRVDAVEHSAFADIAAPRQTGRARSTPRPRTRHHALPDLQIGDSGPYLQDDAHELMAQDDRPLVLTYRMGMVKRDHLWSRDELGHIGSTQ